MFERPPFVVRSTDVPEVVGAYPAPYDAELLSYGRDLGRAAGSRALGSWRERLSPGRRTSFTHAHLREEEMVYVLAGRPTLRWIPSGGSPQEVGLEPGDFVALPAGTGIAHTFWNRTEEDAELLVIGERRTSEQATYPEDPAYLRWRAEQRPLATWLDSGTPSGEGKWPAVRIETPRLVLRPWEPADTRSLVAAQLLNRDHLLPFMVWAGEVPTVDQMLERVVEWQRQMWSGGDVVYGVFGLDGGVLGGTGMHDRVGQTAREIGYWVDRRHERQGLVTEWCGALLRVGFEVLELDRIEIRCDPANERSAAVARRLGFTHEATLPRRTIGVDGKPRDAMVFALYASDFERSPQARIEARAWDAVGRRLI